MKLAKDIILMDLFSGIGGLALGLKQGGFNITSHYFSEIDKHAIANYKYNFTNAKYIGSVTDIQRKGIRKPDVITFGSPCQDFSLAGKRAGMEGKRSSLITEAIKLITEFRPSVFIWENVKGTFSSNNGADFWAIIAAFANIGGYRLEWQLLNTSWFLPQNRERIYLVGHLTGASEPRVFPITENDRLFKHPNGTIKGQSQTKHISTCYASGNMRATDTFIEVPNKAHCLTGGGHSGGLHRDMTTVKVKQLNDKKNFANKSTQQQDRVYDTTGIMVCISSSRTEGKVNIKVHNMQPRSGNPLKGGTGHLTKEDSSYCLDTSNTNAIEFDNNIRRLTEIECERLQGFPDDWTKWGVYTHNIKSVNKVSTDETIEQIKPVSKTQRYKMLGNAVTVNLVQAIAIKLLNK